jgi:hypothetical protein
MLAIFFSSIESIMSAVHGPHSWFGCKSKKQFLDLIWCFFYNKSKILNILLIVKYEKITLFIEFLVLLGPIISRFFAISNEEKRGLALFLSLCHTGSFHFLCLISHNNELHLNCRSTFTVHTLSFSKLATAGIADLH